eukprot:PhM_4_TR14390/c0_g1_i1/m.23863
MRVPFGFYLLVIVFVVFTMYSISSLQSNAESAGIADRLAKRIKELEDVLQAKELEASATKELSAARVANATHTADKLLQELHDLQQQQQQKAANDAAAAATPLPSDDDGALESSAAVSAVTITAALHRMRGVAAPDCLSLGLDLVPYSVVVPERLPGWARPYVPNSAESEPSEDTHTRQSTFSDIATSKVWGATPSGSGSLEGQATDKAIALLIHVIKHLRETVPEFQQRRIRMVDIPCGDMNWMHKVLFALPPDWVEYHGIDIVPSLIQHHQKKYATHGWMHFNQRDVVEHGIPHDIEFDFVFSRHMLQHLGTHDALKVLKSIHTHPTVKYLFTTTYPDWQAYAPLNQLAGTRVRKLNLQLPPAALEPPICWGHDFSYSYLALFHVPLQMQSTSEILSVDSKGG